jgi:hypothetical protein
VGKDRGLVREQSAVFHLLSSLTMPLTNITSQLPLLPLVAFSRKITYRLARVCLEMESNESCCPKTSFVLHSVFLRFSWMADYTYS